MEATGVGLGVEDLDTGRLVGAQRREARSCESDIVHGDQAWHKSALRVESLM